MSLTKGRAKPPTLKWRIPKGDDLLIEEIVLRARKEYPSAVVDTRSLAMDITATHANGCRLKLYELLMADDFNFVHDVFGIARHLDRTTGKLMDHFLPRFHKNQVVRP